MAKTSFSTSDALTKKAWEEKLFRDVLKESYFFPRFAGESSSSILQMKTDLEKGKGDKITFGIRMRLTGSGVTSGQTLEGNEEQLSTYSCSVTLEQYRHAVRDDGALSRQRAMFSIDQEAEQAIKDWGTEKIDALAFSAIQDSPTRIAYLDSSGDFHTTTSASTAKTALDATNSQLSLDFITQIKTWAKTGGNRTQVPIRPVKVEGRSVYVLLVNPNVLCDLKLSSAFQQAMREAEVRGKNNPLFKSATAIWDDVVIHEHENINVYTDGGGGSVPYATCVLMGAQALLWAWGERPKVVYKEFDYDNEHGYAWGMIAGVTKPVFNSQDFGSICVYCSTTNVSAS